MGGLEIGKSLSPVEGQGVRTTTPAMAEQAGGGSWLDRVKKAETTQSEISPGAAEQVTQLSVGEVRRLLRQNPDPETGAALTSRWQSEVAKLTKRYRDVTGAAIEGYVLRQLTGKELGVTGEDKERRAAEEEFMRSVDTEETKAVLAGIVADERVALEKKEELGWRTAVVGEETWGQKNVVKKTVRGWEEGVLIDAKPVYEMGPEEREEKADKETASRIQEEAEAAEKERRTMDPKKVAEILLNSSKYWGLALLADEVLEFVQDEIKEGGLKSPNPIREYRRWKDGRKQKEGREKEGKERSEEQKGEVPITLEEAEKLEAEKLNRWNEVRGRLIELSEKEKSGKGLLPSELKEKGILKDRQEEMWNEFKGSENQEQEHVGWKDAVAMQIDAAVERDRQAVQERASVLVPEAATPRRNPLEEIEAYLDSGINQIRRYGKDGNLPPNKSEAIQLGWYEGVKRNVQAAALQAELALYTELNLKGGKWDVKMDEIKMSLKELGIEVDYLNFGVGIKDTTKQRLGDLAGRYVDYLKSDGPDASEIQKIIKEREEEKEREKRKTEADDSSVRSGEDSETEHGEIRLMNIHSLERYLAGRLKYKSIKPEQFAAATQRLQELGSKGENNSLGFGLQILLGDLVVSGERNKPETYLGMGFRGERAAFLELFNNECVRTGMRAVLDLAGFDLNCGLSGSEIAVGLSSSDPEAVNTTIARILPNRNKPMWNGGPTIWDMKEAHRAGFFETVAGKIANETKKEKGSSDVEIGAVGAIRFLNHTGLFEFLSDKTSEHGLFNNELVRAFRPEKMMVGRIIGKAHDSVIQGDKPVVDRYNTIKEELPHLGLSIESPIPGGDGLTFSEIFFPPERLMLPYLFAKDVVDGSTLWDAIVDGKEIKTEDSQSKQNTTQGVAGSELRLNTEQELFFNEFLRRMALAKVDKLLWNKNEEDTPPTSGNWVKSVERQLVDIAKGLGYVGNPEDETQKVKNPSDIKTLGVEDVKRCPQMKRLANFLVARKIHVDFAVAADESLVLEARDKDKPKLSADVALAYRYGLEGWMFADKRLERVLEMRARPMRTKEYKTYYEVLKNDSDQDAIVAREILRRLAQDVPGAKDLWLSFCKGDRIEVDIPERGTVIWKGLEFYGSTRGGLGIHSEPGKWYKLWLDKKRGYNVIGENQIKAGWYEKTKGILDLKFI